MLFQSSKLKARTSLSLRRGKRDVRALSFELSKMSPQVGLAVGGGWGSGHIKQNNTHPRWLSEVCWHEDTPQRFPSIGLIKQSNTRPPWLAKKPPTVTIPNIGLKQSNNMYSTSLVQVLLLRGFPGFLPTNKFTHFGRVDCVATRNTSRWW